jgi:flagellar protein FlaF
LTQAALRMRESQEKNDSAAMMAAVRLNWRLWTIFQAELLDPNSPVPIEVRSNLISLSNFIDKHTVGFIAEPRPAKLDVLISINRDIAGGLYTTPPADAAQPADQPPAQPPAYPQPPRSMGPQGSDRSGGELPPSVKISV